MTETIKLKSQGLWMPRLLMVISSFTPLFILWAIRGSNVVKPVYFLTGCLILIVVPNLTLAVRIALARKESMVPLQIGIAEDHREFLLVYLFAVLLPMYVVDLDTCSGFSASAVAMLFIIFLFWHMDLYYMNLAFAIFRYRIYTLRPPESDSESADNAVRILISRRGSPPKGKVNAYRISNGVFIEA